MREPSPSGINPPLEGLSRTLGQVVHALLTRSPLGSHCCALARLACIRHAASVRSEPGSNSPLNRIVILSFFVRSQRPSQSTRVVCWTARASAQAYVPRFAIRSFRSAAGGPLFRGERKHRLSPIPWQGGSKNFSPKMPFLERFGGRSQVLGLRSQCG